MSSSDFEWSSQTFASRTTGVINTVEMAESLRRLPLLGPEQQAELDRIQAKYADPESFAHELLRRKWLTAFQVGELLHGRGDQLLLGSYLLEEKLGEGGMGQVFKARHLKFDRTVALKLIRKDQLDSPVTVQRFEREIRAAAKLKHPNVVLALDADEVDDKHFFTMEFVDGTDLGKLVKANGPLPVRQACDYIRQAALGLQHAYEQGLIHRDIKPSNLLLSTKWEQVKVLDLGLARLQRRDDAGGETSAGTITESGMVMGTPDFMAPEQTRDTHTVDIRADLYSLGCTLYFCLAGRAPFAEGLAIEKLLHHQLDEPEPVEKLRPEVPPGLAAVVRKLMAKKPGDRYQTPAELAAVLDQGLNSGLWPGVQDRSPAPAAAPNSVDADDDTSPWSSIARNAPGGGRISDSSLTGLARPSRRPIALTGGRQWWLAGIAAGLLVLAVLVGLIVYFVTDHGTLAIQTVDRSVKIDVLRNGEVVRTIDPQTEPEVSLASGIYQLRLYGPAGLDLDQHACTLSRGSRQVVSVRRASAPAKPKPKQQPAPSVDDAWIKRVAALPADKQANEVGYKLKELNPGCDLAGFRPRIENGVVVELVIVTDDMIDLLPLRAMTGLKFLSCQGTAANGICKGSLTDLSPLKDLRLTHFHGDYNPRLADLTPLRNQPLEILSCTYTDVSDLNAIRGMPLRQLNITHTLATDLTPLGGVPLTHLWFDGDFITDLSPLRGMPTLRSLSFASTKIASLVHLTGLQLTELQISSPQVHDLSPLRGMPLQVLNFGGSSVRDLSPLAGMPLKDLRFPSCASVKDLSPLRGLPLESLIIDATAVSDLAPLAGMPLKSLYFSGTKVSDLSPLKGMPLQALDCRTMLIEDLSPLKDLPLVNLNCDFKPGRDAAVLRMCKSLHTINGVPAADFWKQIPPSPPSGL